MRFLLFGYGSIGKRHAALLREMGHEVVTVDPDPAAGASYHKGSEIESLSAYAGFLDCTPVDVRRMLEILGHPLDRTPAFIEKPLTGWQEENRRGLPLGLWQRPIQVGFCYRWLSSLQTFVESLGAVRIYSLSIIGGQHLDEWHPDADYRMRYHGTPGRGGVLLDSLPHSLFIARWILGNVKLVGSVSGKFSGLDIRTEDTAAVLLQAPTGQPCQILVDYLRQPRASYVEAVTSSGVLRWDFDPEEAPRMYQRQMEVFVNVCEGQLLYGYPDLAEGMAVQELLWGCMDAGLPQTD